MEGNTNQPDSLLSFLPLLMISVIFGVVSYFLAKDKGRNVGLWTVLGAIPIVNMFCIPYFIGAANLRLEKKIDELLSAKGKE